MADQPKFQVVQGEWISSPAWLDLPQTVRIRTADDRDRFARVRVGRHDVVKAAENRRRQPAYEFWGILAGKAPPVPHRIEDADTGLTTLTDAVACFAGIRRPIGTDGDGSRYLAYVLKPKYLFEYEARPPLVLTSKIEVPSDLVFVAYVRLDEPADAATKGLLTHWHFVEADTKNPSLPVGYEERYLVRKW